MGAIRFRPVRTRRGFVLGVCGVVTAAGFGTDALRDVPVVWHADDQRDIPAPIPRDPNIVRSAVNATFFRPFGRMLHPGRFVRRIGSAFGGDHVPPAANVNTLDEVPSSSWFTNRIGLFPLSVEDAARGPAHGPGPTPPWTVVRPKTQGVTPGFDVVDARGATWVVKFDSRGFPGMATAAGVISGRILHAAGYHVPDDRVVTFSRDQVRVGENVAIAVDGTTRAMTEQDLDALLAGVERNADGSWRALSSRFLAGRPMGPFDWKGRRGDDPNDQVDHEHRREVRGLAVIAAWICHFDTKQGNTLDMYVEDGGRHYVRHYLIDFASTLGAGGEGPFPAACHEYSLDAGAVFLRALGVGLYRDEWRRVERPEGLEEVGYFESTIFDPTSFKPLEPNTAFANLTDRDGYWAAKIISAFTHEHLRAIVANGAYRDAAAAAYVTEQLVVRRDKIAAHWFRRVAPLDFFVLDGRTLRFHDLARERGIFPNGDVRYRLRTAMTDEHRRSDRWSAWTVGGETRADLGGALALADTLDPGGSGYPFVAAEVQVHRGRRWSSSVTVYLSRATGRVVALDR